MLVSLVFLLAASSKHADSGFLFSINSINICKKELNCCTLTIKYRTAVDLFRYGKKAVYNLFMSPISTPTFLVGVSHVH